MQPHNPGLIIKPDIGHEKYLAVNGVLRKAEKQGTIVRPPLGADFKPKSVSHRQYKYVNQGQTPECTAFGTLTYLYAAHPYNKATVQKKAITGDELYEQIRAWDIENHNFFDEGATVTAALETARKLGWIDRYEWMYTIRTMQEAIPIAPLIAGTYWYDSMFERDDEGIVKVPRSFDSTDSGHFYTVGKYDAHRDIWWVRQTWGDGDYGIPGDLMFRLLKEEGEVAIVTELDFTP